jgi:hypothetical protein
MKAVRKHNLPVNEIRRFLEPGPIVLVSSAYRDESNIMTMGWHMVMGFELSLIGCYIWDQNHSFEMIRKSRECAAARDDGSSGFETIMDHAYDVLGEMVRDDAISSNERGRIALGVWPRRRRDLLAPFQANKRYCGLTIESCETSELVDPAWKGYEVGGDKEALAIRHAAFYRSVFAPSLVHPSGIEGLIFGSWGYAIRREASLRRSSGRAWPWWR